jgi:3',5'-cyclic-AMP phosphodiesterase
MIKTITEMVSVAVTRSNACSGPATAFPQPAPGTAPAPLPLVVPAEKLRSVLGIRTVMYTQGKELLAVTDQPLAAG